MNRELTILIEQYLQNELSDTDRLLFEQRLTENEKLSNELNLQQSIHEAAKRAFQRSMVQQTAKRYHFRKNLLTAAIVVVVVGALTAVSLLIRNHLNENEVQQRSDQALKELLNKLDQQLPMENIPVEYFNLGKSDTVVLSQNGVLLSVPKSAFLLNGKAYKGPKVIQWQEALDAATIVKGGLNTQSGDRLLETQGMFGMQAFTPNGTPLEVNPTVGVYVQVPVDELKTGMQLFEGKKTTNGVIDWQNPKPLEKLPVQADMSDLDFYPQGYEAKLNDLKWKTGKKDRDSLYLSFEEQEKFVHDDGELAYPTIPQLQSIDESTDKGQLLFNTKCATCHSPHQDGTGPALFGVRQRWADGGAKEGSIYQWVANWQNAVKADPYAGQIAGMKPVDMLTFKELQGKTAEIDAIFDYIDSQPYGYPVADSVESEFYGIAPSKVLGFWQPKFNNTILATRDFEKRMKAIHGTCNKDVLNLYTNNLNKPLYEIDLQVAEMGYSNFNEFAAERVGAIKLDNAHMNNLRQFYNRAIAELSKEAKKNHHFLRNQELAWDNQLNKARTNETNRTSKRNERNFSEEYAFNYANAAKQLGYKKKTVGFTIRNNGNSQQNPNAVNTYNLDAFVANVTVSRTTGTFTDPETKKQATITYNEFTVSVENSQQFSKVMMYLFPDKLTSFQRIDPINGIFNYPLNNDITYNIAIIGINEDGYHLYEKTACNNGKLGVVKLEKTSEASFNKRIMVLNSSSLDKQLKISDDLDWLMKEQANYKIQRLRMEQQVFRNQLRQIVFPCMVEIGYAALPQ